MRRCATGSKTKGQTAVGREKGWELSRLATAMTAAAQTATRTDATPSRGKERIANGWVALYPRRSQHRSRRQLRKESRITRALRATTVARATTAPGVQKKWQRHRSRRQLRKESRITRALRATTAPGVQKKWQRHRSR